VAQALYRKYRSRSLEELVGQEHVTQTLANALQEGRISHAYLLTGPRGSGKTSIARILAHAINDLPYEGDNTHLDIIEIDAASNNGVEDVRDLREKVMLAPTSAKYKVYIIDEVHMLSNAAFNALLKTLEEPPAHAVFILATTEVHKLPATIISRTQRFQFQPVARDKVVAHLKKIADKEQIKVDDEALQLIAEHGDGAFRDSISLLDQLRSVSKEGITAETVEATLGLAPRKAVEQLLASLQKGNVQETITSYEQLLSKGIAAAALASQLITVVRVIAPKYPSLYELIDKLIEVPRAYNPRLKMEVVLATYALGQSSEGTNSKPNTPVAQPKSETTPKPASKPTTPAKAQTAGEAGFEPPAPGLETNPLKQPAPLTKAQVKEEPSAPVAEVEAETITETPKEETVLEQAAPGEPLGEMTDDVWSTIMLTTKEVGPTLYTLIRQAIPHFDVEKQILTLTFRYPLHQKRMEEAKHKQEFGKVLQSVLGRVPEMQVVLNKNAVRHIKPVASSSQNVEEAVPSDREASNVMGLMGGGEVVNV